MGGPEGSAKIEREYWLKICQDSLSTVALENNPGSTGKEGYAILNVHYASAILEAVSGSRKLERKYGAKYARGRCWMGMETGSPTS